MILYPAIDLKDGQAVRLVHGDMDRSTVFNDDPAAQAMSFVEAGCEWLHLVDLNGAFAGTPVNAAPVEAILKATDTPAQLGGGLLYVGERNGFVGSDFTLPDYTTLRAFAEIEPIENVSLRLDVDNIFNETFFTNSFADVWVQPGAPRRFRISARYSF